MRSSQRAVFLCVCALATSVSACNEDSRTAGASPTRDERAASIVNGAPLSAEDAFARGIVRSKTYFARGAAEASLDDVPESCTATVVGPRWLLTARHCIWKDPPRAPGPAEGTGLVEAPAWQVPHVSESSRRSHFPLGTRLALEAGDTAPHRWALTCDIHLLHSSLDPSPRTRPRGVWPPGPRRLLELEAAAVPPTLVVPGIRTLPPEPKGALPTCEVWLSGDEADLAYITLPADARYPAPSAVAAFHDDDVHELLLVPPAPAQVQADVVGYGDGTPDALAPSTGPMRLRTPAEDPHLGKALAMRPGYAHFDSTSWTEPGPQYTSGGDLGGPVFLGTFPPTPRSVIIGVSSYFFTEQTGVPSAPSYAVQPVAAIATMLKLWFEHPEEHEVTPPTPAPLTSGDRRHLIDWNGDGLTDVVHVGPTQTVVRLASAEGFLPAAPSTYVTALGDPLTIPPIRAVPMRLQTGAGGVTPALLVIAENGEVLIYRDEDQGTLRVTSSGSFTFGPEGYRTAANTLLVHVTDPGKDELLLVDTWKTTLVPSDGKGGFDPTKTGLVATDFGKGDPFSKDALVADIDGDGRTDLVSRALDGVRVRLGQSSGSFGTEVFTAYDMNSLEKPLPSTAGVRFVDVNGDKRDDLIWLERQAGPNDARFVHVKLAQPTPPGSFGDDHVTAIEIGESWVPKVGPPGPKTLGGYDLGDIDGDGHIDIARISSFGRFDAESGGVKRTQALFVKPGRGDGTFGPIRVWRLPVDKLGVKTSLADAFGLFPTRKVGRADVVFAETGPAAVIDVVVAK
jgi:hypothetical protein